MTVGKEQNGGTPNEAAKPRERPHRRLYRRWLPWAGAVLFAALLVAGFWPKPVEVETAHASVGPLRVTVNEEGKTQIRHRYTISAPVAGELRRIPFKAGAPVHAGRTVVAVIDPPAPTPLDARARSVAEARRAAAAANLAKARAAHDFAAQELNRFEKLYGQQAISIQDLQEAQWREASDATAQTAAESALREAEAELLEFGSNPTNRLTCAPIRIKSPVDGRVLRVFEESSRAVAVGTPLLEVGDPSDLEVEIDVLSRDAAIIKPGMVVELDQWGGTNSLAARVRLVEPMAFTKVSALGVEEQRVHVIAEFTGAPSQYTSLGDQFRVEAHIVVWQTADTLQVPTGALFREGKRWATFVVAGGRAHLRYLKIGRSSETASQVLAGLKKGDAVIVYPGDRVRDGQRIKPIQI